MQRPLLDAGPDLMQVPDGINTFNYQDASKEPSAFTEHRGQGSYLTAEFRGGQVQALAMYPQAASTRDAVSNHRTSLH